MFDPREWDTCDEAVMEAMVATSVPGIVFGNGRETPRGISHQPPARVTSVLFQWGVGALLPREPELQLPG